MRASRIACRDTGRGAGAPRRGALVRRQWARRRRLSLGRSVRFPTHNRPPAPRTSTARPPSAARQLSDFPTASSGNTRIRVPGRQRAQPVESGCGAVAVGRACVLAAPFVWRCLSGQGMAPFPHPSHRTGHADFPHPALGQDLTPSPSAGRARAPSGARDPGSRRGTRADRPRSPHAEPCASCATTGAAAPPCRCRWPDRLC